MLTENLVTKILEFLEFSQIQEIDLKNFKIYFNCSNRIISIDKVRKIRFRTQ